MKVNWPAFLLGAVAVLLLGVVLLSDTRQMAASLTATDAMQDFYAGDYEGAQTGLERALRWNPHAPDYALQLAALESRLDPTPQGKREARQVLVRAWQTVPLNHNMQIQLALTDAQLIAAGDLSLIAEFTSLMDQLAYQLPNYPSVQGLAGQGYIAASQFDKALLASDRVISMEGYAPPVVRGQAWWVRGAAMEARGQAQWAKEAYQTAIERAPGTFFQVRAQADLDRLNGR